MGPRIGRRPRPGRSPATATVPTPIFGATPEGQTGRCSAIYLLAGTTDGTRSALLARSRRRDRAPSSPWTAHDLTRAELIRVQRAVAHLAHRGMAPTAAEFWRSAALPRAQRLVDSARNAIDASAGWPWSDPGPVPAVAIDELGRWWLRRLRRAAILQALPDLGTCWPEELPGRLAHHEMRLLSQPPWAHGDLLLSAFELAHREIARHHGRHVMAASRARPDFPPLAPSSRGRQALAPR